MPNTSFPIFQVDAFTNMPFAGNPAAVCILRQPAKETWMQAVASEMNLSETAFLVPQKDATSFDLRWFTPAAEVDLCGHATLASAHVMWEAGMLPAQQPARFNTKSGLLICHLKGDWPEPKWITMDFPATPEKPVPIPTGLEQALGVSPKYVGASKFDYLVEVDSEAIVRNLQPDFTQLKALTVRGVIVTARSSTPEFDFVSRFFAPSVGINEDPVTGSAHCCLAPFWGQRLDKVAMKAYQASARGGIVKVELLAKRVLISGQAVTVLKGELTARAGGASSEKNQR
jgi:PhzF family phenazine biosynthesis protein